MTREMLEALICEINVSVPKIYYDMLIACHTMGGNIKELLSNPTFEAHDIQEYYYELKMESYR